MLKKMVMVAIIMATVATTGCGAVVTHTTTTTNLNSGEVIAETIETEHIVEDSTVQTTINADGITINGSSN